MSGLRYSLPKVLIKHNQLEACDVLALKGGLRSDCEHRPATVADDNNERVEVAVFGSKGSYTDYSAFLFGNTDNGGQYLEGNLQKW
ncbi:collagenase [Vibrio lentus]|nr:collagenase [Vibrio lentus]